MDGWCLGMGGVRGGKGGVSINLPHLRSTTCGAQVGRGTVLTVHLLCSMLHALGLSLVGGVVHDNRIIAVGERRIFKGWLGSLLCL